MKARPHRNGNSREDFENAYYSLTDAQEALSKARSKLSMNVIHGRNYQHLPADEARAALEEDSRITAELSRLIRMIEETRLSLVPAIVT